MKSKKTQYMSIMAMFLAIQIILVVTPGLSANRTDQRDDHAYTRHHCRDSTR